jgi:DNA polymerase-3 subunit epsilon
VFWSLLERAGSIGVTHLDDLLALPTIKGSRAIGKLALTEGLPRRPGIYTFKDRTGTAIYIGKATNLRSRVRSYFAGDKRKQVDNMLRDLHTIGYRETHSEIEASVLELRAIADLRPLYNKRSKPPKSLHWMRLTSERFPRLSIARSPGDSRVVLGPFATRRSAEEVMHGLWDATRIRRCTGPGRGCGFVQLGQAACPCDGSTSTDEYAAIVEELLEGIAKPARLMEPVRSRMERLAQAERFEEAALVRDRWSSLCRAIQRNRVWHALQNAGLVEASGPEGASVLIQHGRMVISWPMTNARPLFVPSATNSTTHPPSMAAIDEALLLWKWLARSSVQIVSVEGTLALPAWEVPDLTSR